MEFIKALFLLIESLINFVSLFGNSEDGEKTKRRTGLNLMTGLLIPKKKDIRLPGDPVDETSPSDRSVGKDPM